MVSSGDGLRVSFSVYGGVCGEPALSLKKDGNITARLPQQESVSLQHF
jgi:hypothetical protein